MEFTGMRKTKEEREAEKAKRQQIRELWQSAGVKDLAGFNNLIDKMSDSRRYVSGRDGYASWPFEERGKA